MIDYDPHHWWDHLLDIRGSLVRQIVPRVAIICVWALAITGVHCFLLSLAIPLDGHLLIGFALSLLLVFRTNSSYDRFWEGRRQWGNIVNDARNLARGASVYLAGEPLILARLLRWLTKLPYAMMGSLRGAPSELAAVDLPTEEVQRVQSQTNVPLAISRKLSQELANAEGEGALTDVSRALLEGLVRSLIDSFGACERIHKTPLPFAYVVHLRRALIAYCYSLPLALVERFNWGTVVVVGMISFIMLGIEEIGVQIEDPFGEDDNDLPLERICGVIHNDVESFLPEHRAEVPLP